jgi:hypothetical protein
VLEEAVDRCRRGHKDVFASARVSPSGSNLSGADTCAT